MLPKLKKIFCCQPSHEQVDASSTHAPIPTSTTSWQQPHGTAPALPVNSNTTNNEQITMEAVDVPLVDLSTVRESQSTPVPATTPEPVPNEVDQLSSHIAPDGTASTADIKLHRSRLNKTKTAKATLNLVLELAEKALDGVPVPGAKGAVGAVVRIMKGIDTLSSNTQTQAELEAHIVMICTEILKPLLNERNTAITPQRRTRIERLASDLEALAKEWEPSHDRGRVRRFVEGADDETELKRMSENTRRAYERFQIGTQVDMGAQMALLEKKIDFRDRSNLLRQLPIAKKARHDSGRREAPTTCFPGTRTLVLEDIKSWLSGTHPMSGSHVYWLNGLAGIGKSTIAKTIAEYAQDLQILGASFFFSRNDAELRRPELVFPSLAYQLAQVNPVFASAIGDALEKSSDLAYHPLAIQLKELIIQPLTRSIPAQSNYLIVIDALDECTPEKEAADILQLILVHISQVPFIRVLLTSRPERRIRTTFEEHHDHTKFILHDIEQDIVTQDIRLFVESRLRAIPEVLKLKWTSEELQHWPPKADMDVLVSKSGVLFIYAATSLRFIENDNVLDPFRQLQIILGAHKATHSQPYADLDQLYLQVLRSTMQPGKTDEDILRRFHWVVGTIVQLRVPLTIRALSSFIQYSIREVLRALAHLHSIILTPEDESPDESPRVYHPSFPDFITNPTRCLDPQFFIETGKQEQRLTLRCLEIMLGVLKRDILDGGTCSRMNRDIPSSSRLVDTHVPAHVQYACRYWVSHLVNVAVGDEHVLDLLSQFAHSKLLNWFEAMSLMGISNLSVNGIRDVHAWAVSVSDIDLSGCRTENETKVRSKGEQCLVDLLYDAFRLALSNQFAIERNAMQVYRTALPYAPPGCLLSKTYAHDVDGMRVLIGVKHRWSPCLSAIATGGSARSVAYTSDGARLAVGLYTDRVRVWDAISTAELMSFDHPGEVTTVAFLLDNTHLVSGSTSCTVMLWDVISSSFVRSYEGHTKMLLYLSQLGTSPQFVSGSEDGTIRIWNTTSPECRLVIDCPGGATSFAALPNGSSVVSASGDGVIRAWDIHRGSQLWCLTTDATSVRSLTIDSVGMQFAMGCKSGSVYIYDMARRVQVLQYSPKDVQHKGIRIVKFTPDSSHLAFTGEDLRDVNILDCGTGKVSTTVRHQPMDLSFSPKGPGMHLATAGDDGTCRLWEIANHGILADDLANDNVSPDHVGYVTSLAFSPDTSWLATGGDHTDKTIRLWDAREGTHLRRISGHEWGVYALAFSPDSCLLVSSSGDYTTRVWDIQSGQQILICIETDLVKQIDFDDDFHAFTRSIKGTRVWNIRPHASNDHVDVPQVIREPVRFIEEHNAEPPNLLSGYSEGFWCGMDNDRWWFMAAETNPNATLVCYLSNEYRICGFAFQRDRVVFVCTNGQVLLLDVSQLRAQLA